MRGRRDHAWLQLMRAGRFAEAWCLSDEVQRQRRGVDCSRWPRHEQFIWDGSPLAGKRVLVRCYHGLGDTIQYVRLAPRLREVAAEVILWVQPKLMPLLRDVQGVDRLLPLHDGVPGVAYDVDLELAELLHALRITLDTVPGTVPYLRVPGSRALARTKRRIGLVWQAGEWDARRSIDPQLLAPLGRLPDTEWLLFQRGPALDDWCHDFGHSEAAANLIEEAQAMRNLDLLVSVDSFPAHLAGALGVPVWTLLHSEPDWRWMRERSDSPWYPTMRLIRQHSAGDWRGVIASVFAELERTRDAVDTAAALGMQQANLTGTRKSFNVPRAATPPQRAVALPPGGG